MFSALVTTRNGWVAQLVEQRTENPRVAGSIPAPATSLFRSQRGERIYLRCATRGKKAGEQCSSSEHET
jgi:hypothetical protein